MVERLMTVCDVDVAVGGAVLASARVTLSVDGVLRELDLCSMHLEE
jgi:hypothetical protein